MTGVRLRWMVSAAVVVMATIGMAPSASACSCVESGPACQEYWKATAVFVGRVDSIVRQTVKPPARMPGSRRVTLEVVEPFAGAQRGRVEIVTGSGGGDCGFAFREGATYVVYAQRNEPGAPLTVSICSRTRELARADEDLSYGRAIASGVPVPGRVSGRVMVGTRSLSQAPLREPRSLPDIGVQFERDGTSTRAVTGIDGRFAAEGLAAGRYLARLDLPDGLYAEAWPRTVELRDARACVELPAMTFADGRVSGRAVDAAGRPIAGLTMELTVPAGLDAAFEPERLRTLTDQDGRYEIVHVPAGRFVVGINTQRSAAGALPEPRLFHPGVASVTAATRVVLKSGERVALRDFVLPREVVFVPVTGIVLDPNGAPAVGARVYLKGQAEADYILSEPAITGSDGRFVLAAVAGRAYRLFAERPREGAGSTPRIDASEQVPFTAAAAAPPFKLSLRPLY